MTKYHLAEAGPAVCTANKRPCPVSGPADHYDDLSQAQAAYAKSLEETHGMVATITTPGIKVGPGVLDRYSKTERVSPEQALRQARALVKAAGVNGWTLRLNNRTASAGITIYSAKTIELSRTFIESNSEKEVMATVLHEAAHVLAGAQAGHGPEWQATLKGLGVEGRINNTHEELRTPYRFVGTCPQCQTQWKRHSRKQGSTCPHCRLKTGRRIEISWKAGAAVDPSLKEKTPGVCPRCFLELPASGVCGNC